MNRVCLPSLGLSVFLVACASAPGATPELAAARSAYANAEHGSASAAAPWALQNAHETLAFAEYANLHGDGDRGGFAVLAQKRAELATAVGDANLATRGRYVATAQLTQAQLDQRTAQQAVAACQPKERPRAPASPPRQAVTVMQAGPLVGIADSRRAVSGGTAIVITSGLEFPKNSALLTPVARHKLDAVADALRTTSPPVAIRIQGFTDSTGDDAINQSISVARAASVGYYLASHGVPDASMHWQGHGSSLPIASDATPQGRQANRRVEIHAVVLSR